MITLRYVCWGRKLWSQFADLHIFMVKKIFRRLWRQQPSLERPRYPWAGKGEGWAGYFGGSRPVPDFPEGLQWRLLPGHPHASEKAWQWKKKFTEGAEHLRLISSADTFLGPLNLRPSIFIAEQWPDSTFKKQVTPTPNL